MRAYLPLTTGELSAPRPPKRIAVTVVVSPELSGDEREEAYEGALEDAAFESLKVSLANNLSTGRIVAVGELSGTDEQFNSWDQVDSLMVDGCLARKLVRKLVGTEDQDEADHLVEQLFDEPLEWFDISERESLRDL